MEMDEMELDRYVTDMLDVERRNMNRDVHVKHKTKQEQNGRGDKDEKRQTN